MPSPSRPIAVIRGTEDAAVQPVGYRTPQPSSAYGSQMIRTPVTVVRPTHGAVAPRSARPAQSAARPTQSAARPTAPRSATAHGVVPANAYDRGGNLRPSVIVPTAGFGFRSSSSQHRSTGRYGRTLSKADTQRTVAQVDDAIERSRRRFLTVGVHTPWQIFHGTLALRDEFQVQVNGQLMPAIDWMSSGVLHDALPLVEKTPYGGRMHAFTVPYAFEGHTNQFLAILSLSGLPRTHQFRTATGETVTMEDMVRGAQAEINGEGELTWTLWFLSHYVEPDAEWLNSRGEPWSMERLVKIEARKAVESAPCGGTHRLFALALARNAYLAKHGQVRGPWIEADQRVRRYVRATQQMQNSDGSLSSQWYKATEVSNDLERRLKTSGHQLEWIMAAIPQTELYSHWVQSAVRAVASDVIRSAETSAECGALYHALDALVLYRTRLAADFPIKARESRPPLQQAQQDPAGRTASIDPNAANGWKSSEAAAEPKSDASTPQAAETEGVAQIRPQSPQANDAAMPADLAATTETDAESQMVESQIREQSPKPPIVADAQPLETKLPETVDDEAAPTGSREPNVFRTVSDPKPVGDSTAQTAPTAEMEAAVETDPKPAAGKPVVEEGELQPTAPPSLQVPATPNEARKSEILEASFRFTNIDAEGRFVVE